MYTSGKSRELDVHVWESLLSCDANDASDVLDTIARATITLQGLNPQSSAHSRKKEHRETYWTTSSTKGNKNNKKIQSSTQNLSVPKVKNATADVTIRPICCLEKLAQRVLSFHCDRLGLNAALHGAEWWIRVHKIYTGKMENCASTVVPFHFDKNETLRETHGRFANHLTVYFYDSLVCSPNLLFILRC